MPEERRRPSMSARRPTVTMSTPRPCAWSSPPMDVVRRRRSRVLPLWGRTKDCRSGRWAKTNTFILTIDRGPAGGAGHGESYAFTDGPEARSRIVFFRWRRFAAPSTARRTAAAAPRRGTAPGVLSRWPVLRPARSRNGREGRRTAAESPRRGHGAPARPGPSRSARLSDWHRPPGFFSRTWTPPSPWRSRRSPW